ncbi:MAG TPA: hypothetical protein ENI44_05350 [Thermoplasmatales archaeon]|nr:hypothetical protein [Thermoplasmatales archaeon]
MRGIIKIKRLFYLVFLILIISGVTFDVTDSLARQSLINRIINKLPPVFDQYIDINYDPSVLNQTFDIHKAINVPIEISYWTTIRDWKQMKGTLRCLLKRIAPMQVNRLFFGKLMPQQRVYINITDKPDWAEVEVVQPVVPMDIPLIERVEILNVTGPVNETITFESSIIISPLEEAPSKPYSIGIKVECPKLGLLKKGSFEKTITFRPRFLPKIEVRPDKTVQIALPHNAVNFKITVTNYANKKMRIQPDLKELPEEWRPTINPPFIDINPGEKGSFYFSVFAPYDFGWHDSTETFRLNFTATSFPIDNNSITGGPYQISLTVNNYGFSLPGFEYLGVLVAMLVVLIIRKTRRDG